MVPLTVARFARFADVLDLGDAALRDLMAGTGDEPERVWAAWVIGLRHQPDAAALLAGSAASEPSPGVRAHLTILLMSYGERAAVVTIARSDPAAIVRASAYRCLARVAAPNDRELVDLLVHGLGTEDADLRAAIVDGLRTDAPSILRERALLQLGDGDLELRRVVVDFALRCRQAGEPFPAALSEHAPREVDANLFGEIVDRWMSDSGPDAIARAMPAWPASAVARMLARWATQPVTLAAADLEPLLARGDPVVDDGLATLVDKRRVEAPLRWLLHFAVAGQQAPNRWHATRIAHHHLGAALGQTEPTMIGAPERALVRQLLGAIEKDARDVCAGRGIEVDDLVRFARGERLEPDAQARLDAIGDEYLDLEVFGVGLLPELRRLVARK